MIYAAIGILIDNNKILITQRTQEKTFPGFWEFPGGKLESLETAKIALIRELKEELGIEVISCNYLFSYEHDYGDRQVNLSIWKIQNWIGQVQALEKQAFVWVTLDELESYLLLDGARALIPTLKAILC